MIQINNMNELAWKRKYIVCQNVNNEFWFWGAWDDVEKAHEVAKNIDGYLIVNEKVN